MMKEEVGTKSRKEARQTCLGDGPLEDTAVFLSSANFSIRRLLHTKVLYNALVFLKILSYKVIEFANVILLQ